MDVEQVNQGIDSTGERTDLFAARPALYIALILSVALATYAYKLRTDGIFSCQADGYSQDNYLAYCQAASYGDYEHGAFWFGLESSVLDDAGSAEVMFLGDSRMQYAFSTESVAQWFSIVSARYYLLGFIYGENVRFSGELLRRVTPKAKAYVITTDFFDRSETIPAKDVMRDPSAHYRYKVKHLWQRIHLPICRTFPSICGNQYAIYRSRQTGSYQANLSRWEGRSQPVVYDHDIDQERIQKYVLSARDFLSRLSVDKACVILTTIPTIRAKSYAYSSSVETTAAVAGALGLQLIAPDLDGLTTFDGSHLDRRSAEEWSKAFLQTATPMIRKCLK